jgi:AcrR family transcriptional regulator
MATTTASPAPARTGARRTPRDSAATKRRILDASERVVLRDGVGHLTLDAAAAEAGLSKGGVLYHFPTRDALVAAMVTRIIEQFDEDIASYLPEAGTPEAGRPGAYARAYVRATLEPVTPGEERLGAALLAAAAAEPELVVPLQTAAARWQARLVDDGIDPTLATLIRLACDGLWLCGLFGLATPEGDLLASVSAALEQMARVPS